MSSTERHTVTHGIITATINDLSPHGLADVTVQLHAGEFRIPVGADPCIWSAPVGEFVDRIHAALYGRGTERPEVLSPVQAATEAKQRRDLGGELGALLSGEADLEAQSWYPARAGDLVHLANPELGSGDFKLPAYGETYAVEAVAETGDERGLPGDLVLRLVHHTAASDDMTGFYAPGLGGHPLMEMWMEAGAHRLVVVRDGVVVHNGPGTARA